MLVTKDPVTTVIRERTKYRMKLGWAVPVLAGDIIPGWKKPKMFWGDGQVLEAMAYSSLAESPEFKKIGIGAQKLATGLELSEKEKTLELADPSNALNQLRVLGSAIRAASDDEVKVFGELLAEGSGLLKEGALENKVSAKELKNFTDKAAAHLEGPLHRFNNLITADSPELLLRSIQPLELMLPNLGTKLKRDTFLAALSAAKELAANQKEERAKQIRATFEPVRDTFVAALAYCLNVGFVGPFGFCHIPRTLSPAKAAAFMVEELIERKERCYDLVLLNPIEDPSVLTTHWSQYFSGEELVQATVFASLDYHDLDELAEKASMKHTQSGSAAAHFCVSAGFGTVLGRRCPIGPAVAGGRRKRDGLLAPLLRHFGVLESSFGCQDDKAVFGFEDIDTLALRDGIRARFAENGVNTPAKTDGMVHLFRANSLSSDLQFSQYDSTRAANWFIGTMRQYMRKVTIAQCNDSTLKAMVAAEVTELLNAPFAGKADFEVVVTPGDSADPREFVIALSLPELAYVETIKILVELKDRKKK